MSAKARLRPELPIVQEYITARGIKYEMLERFEWGYVPHDEEAGQVECLVVPFRVRGKIRAIRGRAYDGRKGAVKNSRFSLWNLDSLEGKSQAVTVERESDALRTIQALEACGVDIPVVSVPGNNFRKEWKREVEGIQDRFSRYYRVEELLKREPAEPD